MLIYSKYYKDFSYKISKIQLKTEDHTDGDFAFIHDASEVRYQYYHNCNFTEVGEPFAEQPLAVAVQQVRYAINQISFVRLSLNFCNVELCIIIYLSTTGKPFTKRDKQTNT